MLVSFLPFHLLFAYATLMHFIYPFRLPSSGVLEPLQLLNIQAFYEPLLNS